MSVQALPYPEGFAGAAGVAAEQVTPSQPIVPVLLVVVCPQAFGVEVREQDAPRFAGSADG